MKKAEYLNNVLFSVSFVSAIILVASCDNSYNPEDARAVSEKRNTVESDKYNQEKDVKFLDHVSEINLEQIRLGQLAQRKGKTEEVRELGKMVEDAHTKLQRDLNALARIKRMPISGSTTNITTYNFGETNKESEYQFQVNFDKTYADKMVSKHKDVIEFLEKASSESYDLEIKSWVWSCYICTDTKLRPTLNNQNTLTQWQKPEKFTARNSSKKQLN